MKRLALPNDEPPRSSFTRIADRLAQEKAIAEYTDLASEHKPLAVDEERRQ
jgi:hypothetical protein